ncbi:MAG: undecaprenyl/decaprenyl-phosphate alpha-N-acetylglucosaminyl 1-phosphate transferase [Phycisphaerae bacterium]|nr:undecaprenyl/decaprenyl-phosphate alpha-N-acetylglucosaminyl 1-phosphate transferase [Phycisphaerae bacterium]
MRELFTAAIWPFVAASAVALIFGPIVRRASIRLDFFDRPDGGLKPHDRPIPYLGGIAIYLGWLAALILTILLPDGFSAERFSQTGHAVLWISAGGTILMLIGLIDDIRHLPPIFRLFMQAAVAGVLLYGGVGRTLLTSLAAPLIGDTAMDQWSAVHASLAFALIAFIIAGATNSTNLIDGMDGLCAGVTAIACVGFITLAAPLGGCGAMSKAGALLVVTLSAAVIGACLAFLFFNFNPASMFMGDSGSLLLGFSIATMIALFAEHAGWRGLICSTIVFGFPIFDTALAVGRRRLNRKPLFKGDRSHFYDQLRDRGRSVRSTVVMCYGLELCFVLLGVFLAMLPIAVAAIIFVLLPIICAAACKKLGFLRVEAAVGSTDVN